MIENFINRCSKPYICSDVRAHVKFTWGFEVPKHEIKKNWKNQYDMSYKNNSKANKCWNQAYLR